MSKIKVYFKENLVLVIAFVVLSAIEAAVVFPLFCVDYLSYDSSYQYALEQHTIPEIWELLPYDYSPPFYAIALKLYCMVFGHTLLSMRCFTVFAVIGMYFLSTFPINTIFGKKTSLICLLITFASTNLFTISNEIRPTIFGIFLFEAVAVYAGIVVSKGSRYSYICLTVFSVLAMHAHNVAMVGTFSVYVALLLVMLITKNWKKLKYVFISGCICGALYLPWLKVVLSQLSNVHEHYWTTNNSFSSVTNWIFSGYKRSYVSAIIPELLHLVLIIVLLIALFKHINFKKLKGAKTFKEVLRLKADNPICIKNMMFFMLCLVLSLAIMELVAVFLRNIRAERYYYILATLWIVVISAFLGNYGNKVLCTVFAVLMLTNHTMNVINEKQVVDNADILDMVEEIRQREPDGELCFVHFHEHSLGIMYYYFPEATHYVCDETFTVLGTYGVFPCEVVDIGSIDNIWEYTDSFYMFKNKWKNADWDIFLVDELERMNDNEIVDIGAYYMPFAAFGGTFELSEAVHTGAPQ